MLTGKSIVLGVTGSIAAYKIANLASMLVKLNADVHVIMTQNATRFITPMTFETLTNNKCIVDTFDRNFNFDVKHVSLAKKGDLFLVAPCTANVIGKVASGICDDMLTTTIMATKAPVLFSPAMNTGMWENPILQDNLQKLKHYGYHIIEPVVGRLACGDTGSGKMPSEETLLEHILLHLAKEKDLSGKKLLITAGPVGVNKIDVMSAQDMFEAVTARSASQDAIIMCSAVADYKPATCADQKMKKSDADLNIALTRTQDILGYLGAHKREGQILIGFSMETEDLIENSREKLMKKNADLICANSISSSSTGFAVDTNQVTLISQHDVKPLPLCSKEETADLILDEICTF